MRHKKKYTISHTMATSTSNTSFDNMFDEFQSPKNSQESKDTDLLDLKGLEGLDDLDSLEGLEDHVGHLLHNQNKITLTPAFLTVYSKADKASQENMKALWFSQFPSEHTDSAMRHHKEILLLQAELATQETQRLKAQAEANKSAIAEPETEIYKAKTALIEKEIELATINSINKRSFSQFSDYKQHRTKAPKAPRVSKINSINNISDSEQHLPKIPKAPRVPKASLDGLRITKFYAVTPKCGRAGLYLTVDHGVEGVKTWKIKEFNDVYGITSIPMSDISALKSDDFVADDSAISHNTGQNWSCVKKALCT